MKLLVTLILTSWLSALSADVQTGENIYMRGVDESGKRIPAMLNGLPSRTPIGCVQCHRESGIGTSESGKTIPPVSWRFLGREQPEIESARFYHIQNKRKAYDLDSLHRVLTTGVNSNGEQIDNLMPIYTLDKTQVASLMDYLKTLYSESDPGVDDDNFHLATIIDSRLPAKTREQHIKLLQGLVDMKNSLTRGELKRKAFSPIQKVPQYTSFRFWKLDVWELPADTSEWRNQLDALYKKQPVFVVLRPLVQDSYDLISSFCSINELPCMFASGQDMPTGDFFNFAVRDLNKQHQDYLQALQREYRAVDQLVYISAAGDILPLDQSQRRVPPVRQLDSERLQAQFNQVCSEPRVLLAQVDINQAKTIDQLTCPESRQIKIRLLSDERSGYVEAREFVQSVTHADVCWVSDYDKVLQRNTRSARVVAMAKRFALDDPDQESVALTLFAYSLLSDALHQMAGSFSRYYMMELMEHMLNSFLNYTYYSAISGAPYRRFLSGPVAESCKP